MEPASNNNRSLISQTDVSILLYFAYRKSDKKSHINITGTHNSAQEHAELISVTSNVIVQDFRIYNNNIK